MKALLARVRALLDAHPRTVRYALVLAVVAAAGFPIAHLVPRGVGVDYDLGEAHGRIRVVRFAYVPVGGESARAVTLQFDSGAPRRYEHRVELAPGRYEVHAWVRGEGLDYEVVRYLDVPPRDTQPISLEDRGIFDY